EQYLERISWMKSARRDISLTTDIIVGFPGETEDDFQRTLTLLDVVEYDGVFSFKYSPRPNTPALHLEDAIPDEEKSRRLSQLMDRQSSIQKRRNERHLGKIIDVMVEGRNQARAQVIGRTSHTKTAHFVTNRGVSPVIGT